MIETGFTVTADLPFACRSGQIAAPVSHGSLLLLRVVNLLDAGEAEPDRAQDRVEARLDLMLHWLGQQLFGNEPLPRTLPLKLEADRIAWPSDVPLAAQDVVLSLHIHPALAAPLNLPARIAGHAGGHVVAELRFDSEELSDAWTQWLFRRHRRAVHEARQRGG